MTSKPIDPGPPKDLRVYFGDRDSGGYGIEFNAIAGLGDDAAPAIVLWRGRVGSELRDLEAAVAIQQCLHAGSYLGRTGTWAVQWCGKPATLRCKSDGSLLVRDRDSGEVALEVEAGLAKAYSEAFSEATRRLMRANALWGGT